MEIDKNGGLALLPEDRSGWDLLIGAVHYLPPEILNGSSRFSCSPEIFEKFPREKFQKPPVGPILSNYYYLTATFK